MTTKQDVINARDNYLRAASEMQNILRQLDGIIENGKRGVLVVANATPELVADTHDAVANGRITA